MYDSEKRDNAIFSITEKYLDSLGQLLSAEAMGAAVKQSQTNAAPTEETSAAVGAVDVTDDLPF